MPRRKFSEGLLDEAAILEKLYIQPGQTIIDGGCGTGFMAKLFAEKTGPHGRVYAADNDPNFIDSLQTTSTAANLLPILADITTSIPLTDHCTDAFFVSGVLHMFSSTMLTSFLRNCKRIIKPGGMLAVVEMVKDELPFGPPVSQKYSPEELKKAISLEPLETVSAGQYFYLQRFINTN